MSTYPDYWNNAELSAKIDDNIERHRKSDATVRVTDAAGKPLPGVSVAIKQLDSSFHFGANIFKLDGFSTPAENRLYEDAFCGLFNAATVPFYWKGLEPERGKLRFAADSPPMPRRPPPDRVVAFCEEHGLRMHGHCLVWNFIKWSIPDWLPDAPAETRPLWEERIRQIAERYGHRIHRWDVLNEATYQHKFTSARGVFPNYERHAFQCADRYFPRNARLDINDLTAVWDEILPGYFNLIARLLDDGAKIGGIGLQFHVWSEEELRSLLAGKVKAPAQLLAALDKYAEFGFPLHVSEITLPSPGKGEAADAIQAQAARGLYRLWFSHAAVDSITWWNLPDGGAAPGEDILLSGLLASDLKPKAAYHALHDLIHREWRTHETGVTDSEGKFSLRGFHGEYEATASRKGTNVSTAGTISAGSGNEFALKFPG